MSVCISSESENCLICKIDSHNCRVKNQLYHDLVVMLECYFPLNDGSILASGF